ncbi:helix-turn-helix transcriptional regulator [Enterocloster clostridioformis]|uniref:helix-turn-helix domain-containing protein n=1 Tax=Enterocloster clostridioformis TaxID=1531 RepID=UPI001F1CC559|nr:helix-turn-helix transcriptional regulator [Enterocloster clostridioformis]MCF2705145.1 helix-turn-helix transcriptional regulator [Enterocloster clostridioformis]
MVVNERIKDVRKSLNLTLEEFGKKLCVTKSTLSNIENGNRNITDRLIRDICREFDVSEDWLRTGSGEMFEQLTEQQKAMKYTAKLLKDTDFIVANAIKNFIVTYEQLDDTSKKVLEEVALRYLENAKRGQ